MICPRCGTELNDMQKPCPSCGYMLSESSQNGTSAYPARSTRRAGGLSKPSFDTTITPKSVSATPRSNVSEANNKVQAAVLPVDKQPDLPVLTSAQEHPAELSSLPSDAKPLTQINEDADAQKNRTAVTKNTDDKKNRKDKHGKESTPPKKGKKKKRRVSKSLRIFIVVVTLAILIGGGFFANSYVRSNYKTWPRMFKVVFGIGQTQALPVIVEQVTGSDGLPAHKFTIQGDNPDVALVRTINNQAVTVFPHLTFIDGVATITIPDSYFIPPDVTSDEETMTAQISFAILDNRGNETEVPCDPVVIDIPQSVVTNLAPSEETLGTYEQSIALSMNVLENSTVTINGENTTSNIVEGVFTKALPVEMGENSFDIVVTTPFYRAFRHTLTVTRTLPPVTITVGAAPPSRTEAKSITISGTMEKNAALKLTGKGKLSYSKSKGTFTVTLSMSSLGLYEGTLTATLSGKSDGVYAYRVERIPDATAYQKAASTPDLTKLFADFSDYKGDKLKLSGTVTAMGEGSFTILLGENQQLVFSYYGDTAVAVGDTATVYGEIRTVVDNVPACYAWFVVI